LPERWFTLSLTDHNQRGARTPANRAERHKRTQRLQSHSRQSGSVQVRASSFAAVQASLRVGRVWIEDGRLTVVGDEGAAHDGDVAILARRVSDDAQVAGSAAVEDGRLIVRLELADLVPSGPDAEDWRLEATVAGSALSLAPGAAYEQVPDVSVAFAFPTHNVPAGSEPRRFRPLYDADGALSIRSTKAAPRAAAATRASAGRADRVRALRLGVLRRARMLAHRIAHAGAAAALRRRPAPAPGGRRRVVILLAHAWGMGGTTRTCLNVAGHLAQRHDVTVLSAVRYRDAPRIPFPPGVEVVAADDQRGRASRLGRVLRRVPTVLLLPRDRRMSRWASLRTDVLLARALWRQPADVVMATRPALNVLATALARPGTTVIGQEHINLATHREELRNEIARRYRGLDVLVTLVERDREEYRALLGDAVRIECIPNGVPELPGPPAALDGRTVVAVGRLTRQKGFDRLIPAFAQVVRTHPEWTLRICGAGGERKRLERLIARHELHNHVLLLGTVEHVEEQLRRASVFVMSSRFEGLPMALIEAMSKGLPVVSFDSPTGPADVIQDGRSGLLVAEGDINGLARAMLTVIEDESLRRRLAAGAIARASDFSTEAIGPRWDALLAPQ